MKPGISLLIVALACLTLPVFLIAKDSRDTYIDLPEETPTKGDTIVMYSGEDNTTFLYIHHKGPSIPKGGVQFIVR